MALVYMFPGHHSHYPEMIDRLRKSTSVGDRILNEASDILKRDLKAHYSAQNISIFERNRDVQVGVFLANYIFSRSLETEGLPADSSVGFSLGEYNHLVEIGVLSFTDALKIIEARGKVYENGPQGMMVSVSNCDEQNLRQALLQAASVGFADVAARLGDRCFIVAGDTSAIRTAVTWLEDRSLAQTRVFDSARPMHVRMFRQAADVMRPALESARWQAPSADYLANCEGRFLDPPSARDFIELLLLHMSSPIQWSRSIDALIARYPNATFLEVGPKSMLHNLFIRDHKNVPCLRTDDPENASSVFRNTVAALRKRVSAA